nr:FtsX-like permease family protein [Deltaproteobacteria bacterium]
SNIMLITVKERTKEIGVRKALGATPRSIIAMVMKESVVLTAIAGLFGVAVGIGFLALTEMLLGGDTGSPGMGLTTVVVAGCLLLGGLGTVVIAVIRLFQNKPAALRALGGLFAMIIGAIVLAIGSLAGGPPIDSPMGPPDVGLSTVLLAVGVLVVAGAFAGIMPAAHAASIRPIEALRAE